MQIKPSSIIVIAVTAIATIWLWFYVSKDFVYGVGIGQAIYVYLYQFIRSRGGWKFIEQYGERFKCWFHEIHDYIALSMLTTFVWYLVLLFYAEYTRVT